MDATKFQGQMATQLIQSVLGQVQQSQTDLAMKMAQISLSQNLQSPPGTAGVNGVGALVDVVG
ncbi:MAG: hypothetical protein O7G87_13485 [bacterium]|nr:hypothetical protein [bacterium]